MNGHLVKPYKADHLTTQQPPAMQAFNTTINHLTIIIIEPSNTEPKRKRASNRQQAEEHLISGSFHL
jgi:hypothetical protein